jgi:hypothetical protein
MKKTNEKQNKSSFLLSKHFLKPSSRNQTPLSSTTTVSPFLKSKKVVLNHHLSTSSSVSSSPSNKNNSEVKIEICSGEDEDENDEDDEKLKQKQEEMMKQQQTHFHNHHLHLQAKHTSEILMSATNELETVLINFRKVFGV